MLPPNPPVRLLNQPGLSSAVLGHAIAAMVALPGPARRAALRRVLAPGKLLTDIADEAEFSELALAGATPMFHPACTCAMGTVVDSDARVVGMENLRVVDASIMPIIPRGNTNIPTIMLAEKCAAQILAEHRGGLRAATSGLLIRELSDALIVNQPESTSATPKVVPNCDHIRSAPTAEMRSIPKAPS